MLLDDGVVGIMRKRIGRWLVRKFKVHTINNLGLHSEQKLRARCFFVLGVHCAIQGDLGSWKFYRVSKAIIGLSILEEADKREEGAALNINKAWSGCDGFLQLMKEL